MQAKGVDPLRLAGVPDAEEAAPAEAAPKAGASEASA
jgi:hypothetical protein